MFPQGHQALIDRNATHPILHRRITSVGMQLLKKGDHRLYHVVFRFIFLRKVPMTEAQNIGRYRIVQRLLGLSIALYGARNMSFNPIQREEFQL